ncbi:MAG: serine acetyltransferase [Hungatella sp.]|nr:serine acetyltransferase [Hungatella sp.]
MEKPLELEVQELVTDILEDYKGDRAIDRMEDFLNQPDKDVIIDIVHKMQRILFPGYYRDRTYRVYNAASQLSLQIEDVMYYLNREIAKVLKYSPAHDSDGEEERRKEAQKITVAFLKKIPSIREFLETDLEAAFDGDPAAASKDEIILSYPGMLAITVYRMAHELFLLSVPLIPRTMTEYAHSVTGIDIHPGASIGRYFFIDHGTGIVVGETTVIGEHVKVYQGVTLGALSTSGGQKLKDKKRHPTIEDCVTIYSNASILGGETVIGRDSVIGGNTFITRSVEAGSRVSIKSQE